MGEWTSLSRRSALSFPSKAFPNLSSFTSPLQDIQILTALHHCEAFVLSFVSLY